MRMRSSLGIETDALFAGSFLHVSTTCPTIAEGSGETALFCTSSPEHLLVAYVIHVSTFSHVLSKNLPRALIFFFCIFLQKLICVCQTHVKMAELA